MADIVKLFIKTSEQFGDAVREITPQQWNGPTPCSEWDVRALVKHLVYEVLWVPPMLEGKTIAEVGDQFEGDVLGDDPAAAWEDAIAGARDAVNAPGATTVTTHLSFGDFPGEEYITQVAFDLFVHGWDLRTAIGADATMDDEFLTAIMPWATKTMDAYRAAGAVGPMPPVPDGASAQTKLLA